MSPDNESPAEDARQAPESRRERVVSPAALRFLLGSSFMGAAFAIPWTLLPLYLDRIGYSKAHVGSVQGAESWGRVLVALPAAYLLARRRTPGLLATTSTLGAAAHLLLPFAPGLGPVLALNLVRGLADSIHRVAIAPFLYRHASPAARARVFGLAEAVHTLAAVLGAFGCGRAVRQLSDTLGGETRAMAWVLAGSGLLSLLGAAAFATIPETPPDEVERPPLLATLRRHRGLFLRFALPQLPLALGAGLAIPFLGLYFQDRFAFAPDRVGDLFAGGQVLMTTGFLVSPWILARLGFVRGMVAVELASIPFFLVLAFSHSLPLAVVAFLLRGALMNTAHPLLKNFMMRVTPPEARELQNGLHSLWWGFGWVLGPYLGGLLLDRSGNDYTLLMLVTVGAYVASSSTTWLLLRTHEPSADTREA